MTPFEAYQLKERELLNRALQLVGPVHPMYNIAPVLDLVRQADALGFDLVRRDGYRSLAQQQDALFQRAAHNTSQDPAK